MSDKTLANRQKQIEEAKLLITAIGSVYYTMSLLKPGQVPPIMSIPTEWAERCHKLMESSLKG